MSTNTTRVAMPGVLDAAGRDEQAQVYRRVSLRLIPFLFICYVAAYLDRINIGFAQLQMKADLDSAMPSTGWAPVSSFLATPSSKCRATCCWYGSARARRCCASWCCGA